MTDKDVIRGIKEGSLSSFNKFYNKYWIKVWHFTGLYNVLSGPEREDIVQDVFLKIWEKRKELDAEWNIDGYIFITTRNMVFNAILKKHNKFESINEMKESFIGDTASVEDHIDFPSLEKHVMELIDKLPPKQKDAFLLSRDKGLSNQEIADKMGISKKGAERNIYLALKFLKSKLYILTIILFH